MPIYEYLCDGCQGRFEVKQAINDLPLSTCQRCGGAVTKLISAPAIVFKGTGWYVTDYSDKLKPTGEAASGDKPADGKKEPKDKKDTAPAPAPAAAGAASESSGSSSDKPSGGSSSGESSGGGTGASTPPSSSSSSTPTSTGSSSS